MKKEYTLTLYKFEEYSDGSKEKFEGRLSCLLAELSARTKLGVPDIMIPTYLPVKMYNKQWENLYQKAKIKYKKRAEKLQYLINALKQNINRETIMDGEYLYELWISRIFDLDWEESNAKIDYQLSKLINELASNPNINPYNIDLEQKKEIYKRKIKSILFGK